jgi:hypothetical protein
MFSIHSWFWLLSRCVRYVALMQDMHLIPDYLMDTPCDRATPPVTLRIIHEALLYSLEHALLVCSRHRFILRRVSCFHCCLCLNRHYFCEFVCCVSICLSVWFRLFAPWCHEFIIGGWGRCDAGTGHAYSSILGIRVASGSRCVAR